MTSLLLSVLLAGNPLVTADLVVHNAAIWTGDAKLPEAQALAVLQGRILKVGTNDEMKTLVGESTKVVDAKGRRVLPGFCDSHVHFLGGGLQLARVELKDCKNESEFESRLKQFDANTARDRWMLGGNWDHERTFNGKLPDAKLLDQFVPNRPAFLRRYDGHMGLANSSALKLANITANTKDPEGGVIGRLEDGKTPSGILKDNAMSLIDAVIPQPSDDEIVEAVRVAMQACLEQGITSVHDMDGSAVETRHRLFRTLQRLDKKGELKVRIDLRWPIAMQKELSQLGVESGFGSEFLRIGGLKGYMDGSLGSSTAKMLEPYVGDSKNTGVFVTKPDDMLALVKRADAANLSVCIHAIGDEANAKLLDLFAEVSAKNGPRDRRFRIEHAQHLRAGDFKRFKAGGVIASMQPYHVVEDGNWAEGRIGKQRCASSYAYRSLLDQGVVLAFGSDWPVATLDVFAGLDAAVNRRPLDGKHPGGWYPEQRIRVAEALTAYTAGSAYAGFQEEHGGTLSVGKRADVIVVNKDFLAQSERDTLKQTKVMMTIVDGKIVYERKD